MSEATLNLPPEAELPAPPEAGEAKERKVRSVLPKFPGIPETGLTEIPADYDPEKYARLRIKDFASEVAYIEQVVVKAAQKNLEDAQKRLQEAVFERDNPEIAEKKKKDAAAQSRLAAAFKDITDVNTLLATMKGIPGLENIVSQLQAQAQ